MRSAEALELILQGQAPAGMHVAGRINLSGSKRIDSTHLPANLTVDVLDLTKCTQVSELPAGLKVRRLILDGCSALTSLPDDLQCNELQWHECHWEEWPQTRIKTSLDLSNSPYLETLPEGLSISKLRLDNCSSLTTLPEGVDVCFLDLRECVAFTMWPKRGSISIGRLCLRDAGQVSSLPDWLTEIGQLDLRGCANISLLPPHLHVTSWIDIGGTAIRSLPDGIDERCLRWRGVPIAKRVVFECETITAEEILEEGNVEVRRVMLELLGYERFFANAGAALLDTDRDTGGERRLLKVDMRNDEDLVCISVFCPSTGRQYIIRVPPSMKTCKQAAAWIAGFDKAEDYELVCET